MPNLEEQYRSLIGWNRFWRNAFLTTVVLGVVGAAAWYFLISVLTAVTTYPMPDGGLRVSSIAGSPVVTHLYSYVDRAPIAAQLPIPVTIIDSEGAKFSRAEIQNLDWRTPGGGKSPPPPPNAKIIAGYYRPHLSVWRLAAP